MHECDHHDCRPYVKIHGGMIYNPGDGTGSRQVTPSTTTVLGYWCKQAGGGLVWAPEYPVLLREPPNHIDPPRFDERLDELLESIEEDGDGE